MNGTSIKLRRYKQTVKQIFLAPYYRYKGRIIVHYIHVPKTGGTSLKIALMSFGCVTPTHYFCLHGHGFTLKNVPPGDLAIITTRFNTYRQLSVYNARKYKCDHYNALHKWLIGMNREEQAALETSFSELTGLQMNAIKCMYHDAFWYTNGLRFSCRQLDMETLGDDFEYLKLATNIPEWVTIGHHNKKVTLENAPRCGYNVS